jgi:hypothetical protein
MRRRHLCGDGGVHADAVSTVLGHLTWRRRCSCRGGGAHTEAAALMRIAGGAHAEAELFMRIGGSATGHRRKSETSMNI